MALTKQQIQQQLLRRENKDELEKEIIFETVFKSLKQGKIGLEAYEFMGDSNSKEWEKGLKIKIAEFNATHKFYMEKIKAVQEALKQSTEISKLNALWEEVKAQAKLTKEAYNNFQAIREKIQERIAKRMSDLASGCKVDKKLEHDKKSDADFGEGGGSPVKWLKELVEHYKTAVAKAVEEGLFKTTDIPEAELTGPRQLLHFVRHVINSPEGFDANVIRCVYGFYNNYGGKDEDVEAALTTHPQKKISPLIYKESKPILDDLTKFIKDILHKDTSTLAATKV